MTIVRPSVSSMTMRLAVRPSRSMVRIAARKLATRNSVARQSAMLEKLSTNQRSD